MLLEENRSVFASDVVDMREIEWFPELFTACGMLQSVFTDGKFTSRVLVLRLCFAECCWQNGQTDSMAEDCLNCYFRFSRKQCNLHVSCLFLDTGS